jgi:hydrogenase nickel incorporation protein HypA/HybF
MHEVAIAQSLIELIQMERACRGDVPVVGVGIRIGDLSDINPDSLEFGYQCLVADTSLAGCELSIERIPAIGKCRQCNAENRFDDFVFVCPNCGSSSIELISGQELEIAWINIADDEAPGESTDG